MIMFSILNVKIMKEYKLQKQTYKTGNLATTTDYIGNFIYENQELKYIQTSYGRIVCENNTYERQYFMKDHLGKKNNKAIILKNLLLI